MGDGRNFGDALFLNRAGCARLTERTIRDVRIAALRKELRAFYPEYGQFSGPVKDPRQKASCDRIEEELRDYMAAHPDYDALDLRRETYLLMRRHFVPFLFRNSPFYFVLSEVLRGEGTHPPGGLRSPLRQNG